MAVTLLVHRPSSMATKLPLLVLVEAPCEFAVECYHRLRALQTPPRVSQLVLGVALDMHLARAARVIGPHLHVLAREATRDWGTDRHPALQARNGTGHPRVANGAGLTRVHPSKHNQLLLPSRQLKRILPLVLLSAGCHLRVLCSGRRRKGELQEHIRQLPGKGDGQALGRVAAVEQKHSGVAIPVAPSSRLRPALSEQHHATVAERSCLVSFAPDNIHVLAVRHQLREARAVDAHVASGGCSRIRGLAAVAPLHHDQVLRTLPHPRVQTHLAPGCPARGCDMEDAFLGELEDLERDASEVASAALHLRSAAAAATAAAL
mmetsp:Transcript_35593/g.115330  ORF Transcript_35593/g.115330 Transcript_35593/m.115330 type:complete len:320 (+) Transcript_35593:449-1408(+)